jgi:hypothetical protein
MLLKRRLRRLSLLLDDLVHRIQHLFLGVGFDRHGSISGELASSGMVWWGIQEIQIRIGEKKIWRGIDW